MKKISFFGYSIPAAPVCLTLLGSTLWPEMELLVPSLPAMKQFFAVTDGEVQQLLTANFIGFLCGVLLAGPLCDSLGRKKAMLWGMLFFLGASALAAVSETFSLMMFARFIQGITVTAPIIGGCTMLLEITSGAQQIFWMSISSASITLCMAMAPLIGAWINTELGFRGNLWSIFVAGLIGILPVIFWVPESLPKEKRTALQVKTVLSGYWQLLKNPRFMGLSIVMAGLAAAYWIYTGVSALYMVDYLKMDPALFGTYQGPIVGTFAAFSIGITWIHKKYDMKTCLLGGAVSMLLGTSALLVLSLAGIQSALLTTIFMMFFVGGMVPANSLLFPSALNQLPAHLQGSGQSLIQALRLLFASVGTMVLGFTYTGPFLPVAIILMVMFVGCAALLWKTRNLLSDAPSSGIVAGH